LNNNWLPAAILPNIHAKRALEGETIALAPFHDPRVQALGTAHSNFKELLSRFTDAFGVRLEPVILIVREDVIDRLSHVDPLASFRDLAALCVIPYGRSLDLVYRSRPRIWYSNSFWLYPWMLNKTYDNLVASTPAITSFHVVNRFHGQSSPDPFTNGTFRSGTSHYLRLCFCAGSAIISAAGSDGQSVLFSVPSTWHHKRLNSPPASTQPFTITAV
jgi:hypothetical protein